MPQRRFVGTVDEMKKERLYGLATSYFLSSKSLVPALFLDQEDRVKDRAPSHEIRAS